MDCILIEKKEDGLRRIAAIDHRRIFQAQNPGTLATVFECSLTDPTDDDLAQIFYALAPMINGLDVCADFVSRARTHRLNSWTIIPDNLDETNLFKAVKPITRADRLELYSREHDITANEKVTSTSSSLLSLVALSKAQTWKTGVLQRCIDCLVFPEHRGKAKVYAAIDEEYRRVMRYKCETEMKDDTNFSSFIPNWEFVVLVQHLTAALGLKHSHDKTAFNIDVAKIEPYLKVLRMYVSDRQGLTTVPRQLSAVLTAWSGAKLVGRKHGGYRLEVDPNVEKALNYMRPLLPRPAMLKILETPM